MITHGNYRRLHYTEAISEAEAKGELLVTFDEVLVQNLGKESVQAIHIVADPDFWTQDEPKGYGVELVRPRWLHGSEGILFPLWWVGRIHDMTIEEIESHPDDDPLWDQLPEHGDFLWAIPKSGWQRCEIPWFNAFRNGLQK